MTFPYPAAAAVNVRASREHGSCCEL
jgi:hypothetical protein